MRKIIYFLLILLFLTSCTSPSSQIIEESKISENDLEINLNNEIQLNKEKKDIQILYSKNELKENTSIELTVKEINKSYNIKYNINNLPNNIDDFNAVTVNDLAYINEIIDSIYKEKFSSFNNFLNLKNSDIILKQSKDLIHIFEMKTVQNYYNLIFMYQYNYTIFNPLNFKLENYSRNFLYTIPNCGKFNNKIVFDKKNITINYDSGNVHFDDEIKNFSLVK